jgi:RES domain-containing protein
LALASLEILVHCEPDLVPHDFLAIEINVPASLRVDELKLGSLPRSWRRYPAPASVQRMGNAWLDRSLGCVLRVPSVVVPSESNFVINPMHPDVRKLRVIRKTAFRFDSRLETR